ncbi:MAG: HAD family hydrolase [Tepidiformaceae bacterium]
MNIFFDVDDTLITWDVRLRPGVREVFARLREDGHTIYLWSGYGPRWEVVRRFELHEYIEDCFWKPLHNHHARLIELGVPFAPDYAVDDHEEIIRAFGGTVIQAASGPFASEGEMWRVYETITRFVAAANAGGAEAAG